jgi:hypothetical protein
MSNSMKAMRAVRRMSQSICIILLLFICGGLSAHNAEHRVRNIVLVHGAWADGSGWKGVYDILVKDGYNVSIVQEPETSNNGYRYFNIPIYKSIQTRKRLTRTNVMQ